MTCWVYKCNSRNREYQRAFGDWREFFEENEPDQHWGKSEWVPDLARLKQGDLVIAYQTDRNEIVGLAKVRQSTRQDGCLYLRPVCKTRSQSPPLEGRPGNRCD
jgi:mRNA-degrading endonuclease RelE of RelBE toxin-antitoxin system